MLEQFQKGVIRLEEILNYYNATISYAKMPNYILGFVHYYMGYYDIVINENLSYHKTNETILHELIQIETNHSQPDKSMLLCYIDKFDNIKNNFKEVNK